MTLWNDIKNYIIVTTFEGKPVRRAELLSFLSRKHGAVFLEARYLDDKKVTSIDTYINYLRKANYLDRVSRGVYFQQNIIPNDLTVASCKAKAYPKLVIREDGSIFRSDEYRKKMKIDFITEEEMMI